MTKPVYRESDIIDPSTIGDDDCLHCLISRVVIQFRRDHPEESPEDNANDVCQVLAELAVDANQSVHTIQHVFAEHYEDARAEIAAAGGHDNPGSPFGHA